MFGLSTRAMYRPVSQSEVRLNGRSPAFRAAYVHLAEACARLVNSGRVRPVEPDVHAGALWSFVHGYITLELAEHLVVDDPVGQVLLMIRPRLRCRTARRQDPGDRGGS